MMPACPSLACIFLFFLSLLFPFLLWGVWLVCVCVCVCVCVLLFCFCFLLLFCCCCCFPVGIMLKELYLRKCVFDARVCMFCFRSAYGLIL